MSLPSISQQMATRPQSRDEASRQLQGRRLILARVLWIVVVTLTVGLFFASIPSYYAYFLHLLQCTGAACSTTGSVRFSSDYVRQIHALGLSLASFATYDTLLDIILACGYFIVGGVLFWRTWGRSNDFMALFASFTLVTFAITFTNLIAALPSAWQLPVRCIDFIGDLCIVLFFYLFPNGRFVPRWIGWLMIGVIVYWGTLVFFPSSAFNLFARFTLLNAVVFATFIISMLVAQIYRYRSVSSPLQRQQTKWVVYGTSIGVGGYLALELVYAYVLVPRFSETPLLDLIVGTGIVLLMLLIPLSMGFAILRSRLWDIDIIISRTLVYGALTACVVALYILVVGTLGAIFQARGNFLISLLATGLVAILFQPLRGWLQRGINRLVYGDRYDPYTVLSHLGRRLEATLAPEAVLPTIVESVAQALKLPYAAITLKQEKEFSIVASYGESRENLVHIPLVYQAEQVGELLLAQYSASETFTSGDRRLLDDLARQAGIAAHAVRLTADLQRSRERLVNTREEERRRLRRDLHDGLGPTLAALNLQVGVIRSLISSDPVAADALVVEWRTELRAAIANIRRLVYELRPPALDELGLVGAIREGAAHYTIQQSNGLQISIEAPETLMPLPAAIEVAAYRIAQEGLANVVNHAQAHTCRTCLSVDDTGKTLELEISDDGIGIPEEHRMGIGLISMRERAAELGGTCIVEPMVTGGTRVLARLPLPTE